MFFDFLRTDIALDFTRRPSLLREQILAKEPEMLLCPIILDEVQKVPAVLDEVHGLIESHGLRFILCGSSARKLKRGKANLLGGRAWRYELFPLVSRELKDFDLLRVLNRGLIPSHYFQENYQKSLVGYIQDYLKEEVFAEGLARNIPGFARFFDAMGYSHGELLNFSNIGRDVGIDAKTVREYFQILVDTLIDFILGDGEIALEVKGTSRVDQRELRSLALFMEEYSPKAAIVVSNETQERRVGKIRVVPWRSFLSELWEGGIIR